MIKVFLTDLDGTLTNGCYYTFSDMPGISKKFNTIDFHGMMLLADKGVRIGIITLSQGKVISKQVERIREIYPIDLWVNVTNKWDLVNNEYVCDDVTWEQIAYIGDDVNDIPLLESVGMAACPMNAQPAVHNVIDTRLDGFMMTRNGGDGCVRQFADQVAKLV